jgi:hypothetical protein
VVSAPVPPSSPSNLPGPTRQCYSLNIKQLGYKYPARTGRIASFLGACEKYIGARFISAQLVSMPGYVYGIGLRGKAEFRLSEKMAPAFLFRSWF